MIHSISIKNFLSHKDTFIELDPGVNVFVGTSDSGKTAIFNAVNWVINNRPAGNEFMSWWGGETCVGIDLVENMLVERSRKGDSNKYYLTDADGETQVFIGFGQKVPPDISETLNMSDINFQFQLDDAFLFSQSPGQIAQYLNQVVDLEMINVALTNIKAQYLNEQRELQTAEIDQTRLSGEMKDFDWLVEAEGCLAKLEARNDEMKVGKSRFKLLGELIFNGRSMEADIDQINKGPISQKDRVDELLQMSADSEDLTEQSGLLLKLEGNIALAEKRMKTNSGILKAEKDFIAAWNLDTEIETATDKEDKLKDLTDDISNLEFTINVSGNEILELEKEYNELMPDICPLCGGTTGD